MNCPDPGPGGVLGVRRVWRAWAMTMMMTMTACVAASSFAAAPVITSPLTASGNLGVPFTYRIAATNAPTSFNSDLPAPGLGVVFATGVISGTPTDEGTYTGTISAKNADGTGTAQLVVTIGPPLPTQPVVTSPRIAVATIGQPFVYQITATNNPTSFDAGAFSGLVLDPATGRLAGTPTGLPRWEASSIRAINAVGTGFGQLTIAYANAADAAPVITSPNTTTATVGEPFFHWITATNSPVIFEALGCPPGLQVGWNLGLVYGTPTAAGTFVLDLTAANSAGAGQGTLTLTVLPAPAPPVITSPATAVAIAGVPFHYRITATNAPASFNVSGFMPNLGVLFATGELFGTFTDLGDFPLTLSATNGGGTGTAPLTISVVAPDSFAAWTVLRGLAGAAAAWDADPDRDGLVNLLEFALRTDPLADSSALAPGAALEPGFLVLTHRRPKTAAVELGYETTTDLAAWSATVPALVVADPDADGDGQVELVQARFPVGPGEPRRFVRLRATLP